MKCAECAWALKRRCTWLSTCNSSHLQAMRLAQLEDLQVRTMDALRKTTDTLRQLLSEAVSLEPDGVNCLPD